MGRNRFRLRPLTISQQRYWLTVGFPQFSVDTRRNSLTCTGTVTPTALSETYKLQITYQLGARPRVVVLTPRLRKREGANKIPHMFDDTRLCLHLPGEWRPDMAIATTIVRWAVVWLFFYEAWLDTGQWLGGGHEFAKEGANE